MSLLESRIAELDHLRAFHRDKGLTHNGHRWPTTIETLVYMFGRILDGILVVQQGQTPTPTPWIDLDGDEVTLSFDALVGLARQVGTHIEACRARYASLRSRIEADETVTDHNEGWPA